jgi:hypothetical protein
MVPPRVTFAPLVNMLESNENALGQKLSVDKTTMLFSQNTRAIVKEHIQNTLSVLIKVVAQAILTYAMSVFTGSLSIHKE